MTSPAIAAMLLEPHVIELDGPPMAYFEIPLDYWATANGEIEPEGHPEAVRLTQRVTYYSFLLISPEPRQARDGARIVVDRVTAKLKELGGGYLWWRNRPQESGSTEAEENRDGHPTTRMRFRLGTTPALPVAWWVKLARDVGNREEPGGVGLRGLSDPDV